MEAKKRTIERVIAAIHALDLDPIKVKLMDAEEGEGWLRQRADRNAREYKRFLILSAKYPDQPITLSKDVDKFWHSHILDTIKYAQDCENVFGYFLHHFPYFGMRGAKDAANLAEASINTARLYEQEFGQLERIETAPYDAIKSSFCSRTEVSFCSRTETSFCSRTDVNQFNQPLVNDLLDIRNRPTLSSLVGI